ncbi:hypothetical protein [Flavobacterium sp. F52]|uniref:hypothetical protein n=1 Tax=Flavobacterium sp. F52 TaxID=1202532 RepID=UPI000272EB1D|nr:hypothetical protein [Flavobacterium sp. F52]EJG03289.1 hypothetical protein FF52_01230 [Flavobacterium sp. F52]
MTERKNIYWMIILLMFLVPNANSQSKLTSFKCDKHLIYNSYGSKSLNSIFLNTKNDSITFIRTYSADENLNNVSTIDLNCIYNGQIEKLNAELYGKNHILIIGNPNFKSIQIAEDLKEVKEKYIVKGLTSKLYKGKIKDNIYYAVLTANFKDGIDYNNAMNVFGSGIKIPTLSKGEIILLVGIMKEDKLQDTYYEFNKSEIIDEEMIFDKTKYIESCKKTDNFEPNDKEQDFPVPSYCIVYGSSQNVTPKVDEEISRFLTRMCFLFTEFGQDLKNEEFQNIFQIEIDKTIAKLKYNKSLDEKEIIQFKKEVNKYKEENLQKNLM